MVTQECSSKCCHAIASDTFIQKPHIFSDILVLLRSLYLLQCYAFTTLQVLERCCVVLQEIPPHLRQKRSQGIVESVHHMTACLTYHMAKVLRMWGQRSLASNINQAARDLLSLDAESRDVAPSAPPAEEAANGDATETGSVTLTALKKKRGGAVGAVTGGGGGGGGGGRKGNYTLSSKEDGSGTGNEELKALEAHMLRLSKQGQ